MATSALNGVNGAHAKAKPNVVIVGGSYVGGKTVEFAAAAMHKTHNIVLVEKNSHFHHLFAFPRFAVVPGYEHLCFIPLTPAAFINPLATRGIDPRGPPKPYFLADYEPPTPVESISIIHAKATQVLPNKLILDYGSRADAAELPKELDYDYLIMATGAKLPPPGTLHTEGKVAGVEYFQQFQKQIKDAENIVIVGGGAIGVQMATDIKEYYPNKRVTIVHSRPQLMNNFHPKLHEIIMERAKELGIDVVLGDRVKVPGGGFPVGKGEFEIELKSGKHLKSDFAIICTGQVPLSDPIRSLSPSSISPTGHILVKPSLQIVDPQYPNVFAIGDVAETGAQKAARPGLKQGLLAVENLRRLYEAKQSGKDDKDVELEQYSFDPAGIHLTLGIQRNVKFGNPPFDTPDAEPSNVGLSDDGSLDMGIHRLWKIRAPGITDYHA